MNIPYKKADIFFNYDTIVIGSVTSV